MIEDCCQCALTNAELRAAPVAVAGPLTNAELRAAPLLLSAIAEPAPTASTRTSVPAAVSETLILAPNTARKGAVIFNDSTSILYIALGTGASATSFTDVIPATTSYEVPFNFAGAITGLWLAAVGNARVTEISP